jgi:hypothetical protein
MRNIILGYPWQGHDVGARLNVNDHMAKRLIRAGVAQFEEEPLASASPDNPVTLRGGYETTDSRLDRVPQWDPRNRNFPMKAIIEAKEYRPRSYSWSVDPHLDQGSEGSCVGHAWAHELIARPKVVAAIDQPFARWIYKTAQNYDAWSGSDYEGTSVLAGAKVVQQRPPRMPEGRGLIDEYRWVFDVDEMVRTLGYFGPLVVGIWWWSAMFKPAADGTVRPTGYRAGGHALLVKAVNVKGRFFTLHNSWGDKWGVGGDCRVSFDDMAALLDDDGEACVPMRRHVIE